ncbi:uncharacterized protein [Palaemon carinicauda]|uniref:uncharacterized protein n=1 Tax=Palaemon carinicauda TaxID=392227 RepID=UPI0035B64BB6
MDSKEIKKEQEEDPSLRSLRDDARTGKAITRDGKVEYLGHVVGENKMWPNKDKVEKIVGAKHPRTKKEFWGLCGYYRKFIPNYSTIVSCLTDLTKKNQPNDILWKEMHDRAFVALKNKIAAEPIPLLQICRLNSYYVQMLRTLD